METMASYILTVLKLSGNVFYSWGIQNIIPLSNENGLSFRVNGMIYKGKVSVVYNNGSDTFSITVGNETFDDICVDELAAFIDEKVEKNCSDNEYEKQVDDWFASDEYQSMFN